MLVGKSDFMGTTAQTGNCRSRLKSSEKDFQKGAD